MIAVLKMGGGWIFQARISGLMLEAAMDSVGEQLKMETLKKMVLYSYTIVMLDTIQTLPFSRFLDLLVVCRKKKYILAASRSFMDSKKRFLFYRVGSF